MGGSLGRHKNSQSYNMSDHSSSGSSTIIPDQSSGSDDPNGKENAPSTSGDGVEKTPARHMRDNSCSSSEGGGVSSKLSSSLCLSWRTRSENWTKSKRRALVKANSTSSNCNVVTKKDFFGNKKSKKWPGTSKKSKQGSSSEASHSGSTSCVCTMYRKTNAEASIAVPSTSNDPQARNSRGM